MDDVENILRKLYQAADKNIEKAQMGIVYIDEIDKLGRKGENVSISRDVGGEGVQQELLKMVEGTLARVPEDGGRKHPQQQCIEIDTTNILFIIGGSFEGIEKIIAKRIGTNSKLGFNNNIQSNKDKLDFNKNISNLKPEDLMKFGMLPEFLGRFPVVTYLKELDEEQLISILTEPKNAIIKQYKELFKMDNIELDFSKEALLKIANKAKKNRTGARGLRSIVEDTLSDLMFNCPKEKEKIDKINMVISDENQEEIISQVI